ncbi:MAG TPA: alcohol dehydrogenase catalytic domain-containing protein [Ilumatobacter sp.]|nr:alcohol dehydrogenase catalytic domain-containing protein [Ilumatobacter sp.]
MLAARWWGRGDVRVEHVDDPGDPPPGSLRIRVEACGLCGTDVEEYVSGPNVIPVEPHPLSGRQAPLTLGHESAGVVEAVGRGVDLDVGVRVAVEGNLFCGSCFWCRRHEHQLCPQLAQLGLMADGGLAEVLIAPVQMCVPFGNDVAFEHAAMAEPLSVAVRAVRRAGVGIGSTVAITGCGALGLMLVQVARLAGARTVLAVERADSRRDLARRFGADLAVAPDDAVAAGLDLTGGIGFDAAIEAAGNPAAAMLSIALARRGGTAILLGVFDDVVPVGMMDLLMSEKTIASSLSHVYDTDFLAAVSLIDRGAVDLGPLISTPIALADVVEKGFKTLAAQPADHLKVMVHPNSS